MTWKILVVDDEPGFRDLIQHLLKRQGFQVAAVRNGDLALNKIDTEHFDLIVLDLLMPGLDGFEICRQIRVKPQMKDIPILIFSVRTDPNAVYESFEAGATDYLPKPATMELPNRVVSMLGQQSGDVALH